MTWCKHKQQYFSGSSPFMFITTPVFLLYSCKIYVVEILSLFLSPSVSFVAFVLFVLVENKALKRTLIVKE